MNKDSIQVLSIIALLAAFLGVPATAIKIMTAMFWLFTYGLMIVCGVIGLMALVSVVYLGFLKLRGES